MKRIDKYSLEKCKEQFYADRHFATKKFEDASKYEVGEFIKFVQEEIKTLPRIATIHTKDELEKARLEFIDNFDYTKLYDYYDFYRFLCEDICVE